MISSFEECKSDIYMNHPRWYHIPLLEIEIKSSKKRKIKYRVTEEEIE